MRDDPHIPGCHPDSGTPTVREERGAGGNVGYGGTRPPPRLAKERVLDTLHLRLHAPHFYPTATAASARSCLAVRRDRSNRLPEHRVGNRRNVPQVSRLTGAATGSRDQSRAAQQEAQSRRRHRRPARPAWPGDSWMDGSAVPRRSPRDPSAERLKTREARAGDGSEVTAPSEGRPGGNAPSPRHERATDPRLGRTGGGKRGRAYGARALGPRSFQRRPRTGKPSTRAQRQGARSPPAQGSRSPLARPSRSARGAQPQRSSTFSTTAASVKRPTLRKTRRRESRVPGKWHVRLCVQARLACSVGENPPREKPAPWSSERRGTGHQPSEAARQPHLWDEGELPGGRASERPGGPNVRSPRGRAGNRQGDGRLGRRTLADAADHSGGVGATAWRPGHAEPREQPSSSHRETGGAREGVDRSPREIDRR